MKYREVQTTSTLMQLAETSVRAIEKEREMAASSRKLALSELANAGRILEAERKKTKLEREKKESLLADCERLCEELEDAQCNESDGSGDEKFTFEESNKVREAKRPGLLGLVGMKGEKYTLEMVELGMELMSRGMTAPAARSVLVVFMKKAHPECTMGVDYRIPDPMMFKRWRMCLEPLSQFVALRAVDQAKIVHLLHDATTKKGVSFFSVCARITVNGKTQNIPLAFKVRPLLWNSF